MEDADYNQIARQSRPLKPGELRLVARSTLANANFEKTANQPQDDNFFHNFHKTVQSSANLHESFYPGSYLPSSEISQNATSHQLSLPHSYSLHNLHVEARRQEVYRSENEVPLTRIFPRAPGAGIIRSESDLPLLEILSSPSSSESPTYSFRTAAERHQHTSLQRSNSVCTQTERSPFEEKFLFRESILLGCDLVAELAQRIPSVAEVREHAEYVREKTIQSRAQNVCSRVAAGASERMIVSEYVKTFIKIADSWLDARNCFGLADRCSGICSLDARDLPNDYIEWMHSSRQLLNTIVAGLEKVSLFYAKGNSFVCPELQKPQDVQTIGLQAAQSLGAPAGPGGLWGYPPNPPCHCAPMPTKAPALDPQQHNMRAPTFSIQQDPPNWYNNQHLPFYPGPPPVLNESPDTNSEYLKPFSYDVPRKNLTPSKKRSNISKAKSDAFQDPAIFKGYVVNLPNTGCRRDCKSEERSQSESSKGNGDGDTNEPEQKKTSTRNTHDWVLSNFQNHGRSKASMKETGSESDDGGNLNHTCSAAHPWKINKNAWAHAKRRSPLTQVEAAHIQEIVRTLSKLDLPESITHFTKDKGNSEMSTLPALSVEGIVDKAKTNVYETLEQFIHDCRRLFQNAAAACQKNKQEKEKVVKQRMDFEDLLEEHFDNVQNWNHISGDMKELTYYPELRYANIRKKPKAPKSTQSCDNSETK